VRLGPVAGLLAMLATLAVASAAALSVDSGRLSTFVVEATVPIPTATPTPTETPTATATNSPTPTATSTPTPAVTNTATSTPTTTSTPTATATPTFSPTPTATPRPPYIMRSSTLSLCTPAGTIGSVGNDLRPATAAATQATRAGSPNTTNQIYFAFTTLLSDPGLSDWSAGNYVVRLNVTDQQGQVLAYRVQILRVSAACGTVAVLGTSGSQVGVGQKTFTVPAGASTGAATDRLQVRVLVDTGGGGTTTRQLTIELNTSASSITVPW